MKFLITGSGGQLGSEWVKKLRAEETGFLALDSRGLDITDRDQLLKILDEYTPDILINCAAYTQVDKAEEEPEKADQINSQAIEMMAELCYIRGIKLVHYSTDYVFSGHSEDRKSFPDGYTENHAAAPINTYGSSKRKGEEAIISSGCEYLIIRVSWLCGAIGNNFVKTMLRLGDERDELNVVNDQWGAPTFTSNVVDNTFKLINQRQSGIFHLSSIGLCTWYDFAQEIFSQAGKSIKVNPVDSESFKTKAKRPAFSKLSTEKIGTISGIELIDWKTGLSRLLKELEL